MPTPQVTNPANLFTIVSPAGKQADAVGSGPSFGQVFSREIAERQQADQSAKTEAAPAPAKPQQAASGSAQSSSSSTPQAAARPASGEAKQPSKSKVSDEKAANNEEASETKETAEQSPEEVLAMVASLAQMSSAAADGTPVDAPPQETMAMVDPAMLLAASGLTRADQAAMRFGNADLAAGELQSGGKALELDADGRGARMKDMLLEHGLKAGSDAHGNAATRPHSDMHADAAASGDLAALTAKGQELMLNAESQSASSDFSAKLQDTLTQIPASMQSVQQIAHAATRAMEGKAADRLTPAVGSPGWDQALGQKVVWMVAGEQQSASLTLNPPDLGPLQVVLNVTNSQATATFTAAQPEVRQALEAAMPKLRDMLGEAGIQLGQATVNSGSPNQQNQQDSSNASRRGGQGAGGGGDGQAISAAQTSRVLPSSSGQGMVDTFV